MALKRKKVLIKVNPSNINELIIFGIFVIEEKGEKCSFERLLKECFDLAPRFLSFAKYKKWPDSRKIDRPLRILRERGLIKGSPKTFFNLTEQGKKMALQFVKTLSQKTLL